MPHFTMPHADVLSIYHLDDYPEPQVFSHAGIEARGGAFTYKFLLKTDGVVLVGSSQRA